MTNPITVHEAKIRAAIATLRSWEERREPGAETFLRKSEQFDDAQVAEALRRFKEESEGVIE